MSTHKLDGVSFEQLKRIARDEEIDFKDSITKDELRELILEEIDDYLLEQDLLNNNPIKVEQLKFEAARAEGFKAHNEDEFEIPETYNDTRIVAMLRDPSWAYCYWEMKDEIASMIEAAEGFVGLFLRVYQQKKPGCFEGENLIDFFDIPITINDKDWNINLAEQNCYYAIALYSVESGEETELARTKCLYAPEIKLDHNWSKGELKNVEKIFGISGLHYLDVESIEKHIPQKLIDVLDEYYVQ